MKLLKILVPVFILGVVLFIVLIQETDNVVISFEGENDNWVATLDVIEIKTGEVNDGYMFREVFNLNYKGDEADLANTKESFAAYGINGGATIWSITSIDPLNDSYSIKSESSVNMFNSESVVVVTVGHSGGTEVFYLSVVE